MVRRRVSQRWFLAPALLGFALLLAGCATPRHEAASVVEYLYPDQKDPLPATGMPTLRLPLRVGLAFVPGGASGAGFLTEERRMELLQKIAGRFRSYPFVKDIELIPTAYLRPRGGFTNLIPAPRSTITGAYPAVSFVPSSSPRMTARCSGRNRSSESRKATKRPQATSIP